MHHSPQFNSASPRVFDAPIARATPSLTSGFGAVMEQEHDLQSSTGGYFGPEDDLEVDAIDQVLRDQRVQLGANISLLERRYEMLPHPVRFQALRTRLRPPTKARRVSAQENVLDLLRDLLAQHLGLLGNIDILIAHAPGGCPGGLLLGEMARNHEDMAWKLSGFLKEVLSVRDLVPIPITAETNVRATGGAEMSWENEGGAPLPLPTVARATTNESQGG
jgi:hypothetical protein